MTKAMKKAVIPALLVASSALAPGLRSTVPLPYLPSAVIRLATRLFWPVWDTLLTRELAQWARADSQLAGEEWTEFRNETLVCLFFQVFLKNSADSTLSSTEKKDSIMSISQGIVRRHRRAGIFARLSESEAPKLDTRRGNYEIPKHL